MKQGNYLVATNKKKIWIDLVNSPHVPFFIPIIEELNKCGYAVTLTARDCFQVCELADLYNLRYKRIGRHYGKNKILKVTGYNTARKFGARPVLQRCLRTTFMFSTSRQKPLSLKT